MLATLSPPINVIQGQCEEFEEEMPVGRSIETLPAAGEEEMPAGRSIETLLPEHQQFASQLASPITSVTFQRRHTSRGGKLRELNRLYGRSEEQKIILDAYEAAIRGDKSEDANLVVVKGNTGTGKTAVAQSIREKVIDEDNGFFVTLRFDHESQTEAGDSFTAAFTSLVQQIQAAGDDVLMDVRDKIRAAGLADCALLLTMMPMMEPIIGTVDAKFNSVEASGRHMQIFQALVRAISTKEHPLVFLFDDVQFSDTCSHVLLSGLIPDADNSGVLYIVTMGPEEPTAGVEQVLQGLQKICNITTIELGDLNEANTNLMVADILHVEQDVSAPMTKFLHHYTKGNALFVIELLHLMFENQVLTFDEESRTWNTNDERTEFICECKDFETLMRGKLDRLQQPVKEMLKAAACIGTKIDINFLDIIMSAPVIKYMHMAVTSGLIIAEDNSSGLYRFATNAAREAAYYLIPREEQEPFHLAVGRKLLKGLSEEQLHEHLSLVLGQMKRGVKSMTKQKERYATASLCLKAAEKAVEWSSFSTAEESLDFGISLLGECCWREEYDLSLAIYSTAAEVGYVVGAFSQVQERIEAVLTNARVFDHKLQALCVKVSILSATAKVQEAIDVGLEVLKQIGEPIIAYPTRAHVMREYISTRRVMKNKSPDTLLRLPAMTDHHKAAAMQIINLIVLPSIFGRPMLMPLLAMRATRITVSHGLCAISAVAFGLYGMLLVSVNDQVDEATRFGELALQLLERFDSKQWLARVHVVVYGCIFGWTKGVSACIEPLKRGYDVGIESGDVEYAMLNGNMRNTYMFCTGTPLPEVRKDMLILAKEMVELKQNGMLRLHNTMLQTIEAFMESDCNKASGHLIREDTLQPLSSSDFLYDCWFRFTKVLLSYFMGDYTGAASEAEVMTNTIDLLPVTTVDVSLLVTFDALARVAYCRQSGKNKRKTLAVVRKRLKRMERYSRVNQSFCLGMTYFLKAEIAWLTGKHSDVPEYYFTCVSLLGRVKMFSVHAMASERAGQYMLECGKIETAKAYFQEAVSVLDEWGAQGKSNALNKEMKVLFDVQ